MTAQILKFARRSLDATPPVSIEADSEPGVPTHGNCAAPLPNFLDGARLTLDTRNAHTAWGITERNGTFHQLGQGAQGWITTDRHTFEQSDADPAIVDELNAWLHARINHPCISTRNQ